MGLTLNLQEVAVAAPKPLQLEIKRWAGNHRITTNLPVANRDPETERSRDRP